MVQQGRPFIAGSPTLVAMLLGLSLATGTLSAQELLTPPTVQASPDAKLTVRQLLVEQWSKRADSKRLGAQTYTHSPHQNRLVQLAYAVNRIHHHQARTAHEVIQSIKRDHPDDLDTQLISAWLNCLIDRFDAAAVDLQALAEDLQASPLPAAQQTPVYRRMGKLIAYLSTAVEKRTNDDLVNSAVAQIQQGQPALVKEFQQAREDVTLKYQDLLAQQAVKIQDELAKNANLDRVRAAQLQRDNVRLEDSSNALSEERTQLRSEANRQLDDLAIQADDRSNQLGQLDSDRFQLEQQLANLYTELYWILELPPRRRPSTYWLRNQILQLESELWLTRNQAWGVSDQLAATQRQAWATQNRYQNRLEGLAEEQAFVERGRLRNQGQLERLARGPKVASGKQSAMSTRRTALRTYDDLSMEDYKQRLLNALK